MNEHISAGCPFDKTETLFVVEPFNFSHFLAHYSDSFVKRCHFGERKRRHYTKLSWAVKLTETPKRRMEQGVGGTLILDRPVLQGVDALARAKPASLRAIRNRHVV